MLKTSSDPSLVSVSISLYRALLALYPVRFKAEYGSHMAQVFRDCCRRAYLEGGSRALVSLWARTALDYLKTIIEEYARGGVHMTREKFIKMSGWALVLGSIAIFFGWLAESRPQYSQYNASSLPIDHYANVAAIPIMVLGMLLISLGMLGLRVRYGAVAGRIGRFLLVAGALSGLVSAIGIAGLAAYDSDPWWSMFFLGMTLQYMMLGLFGIVCLRRHILPAWNGLPLLAGVWIPGYVLVSVLLELQTGNWIDIPEVVFYALWLLTLIGFAGLGILLQSDSLPDPTPAVP